MMLQVSDTRIGWYFISMAGIVEIKIISKFISAETNFRRVSCWTHNFPDIL